MPKTQSKTETLGSWEFKRMNGDDVDEFHRLKGTIPQAHEGYFRENNGSWTVSDANGNPVARVCFRGKAKRGQEWNAPDPEGQSYARLIAAAPELLKALKAMMGRLEASGEAWMSDPAWLQGNAAIAKAEGR